MFVAYKSQAISIGTSATRVKLTGMLHAMDRSKNPDVAYRRASHMKIVNTHSSHLLYWRRDSTTITTANAEGVVGAGKEAIIPLQNDEVISMIASGSSTTGYIELGSSD
jgi:hypothetical protein